MSDDTIRRSDLEGAGPIEAAAEIDALMALPIKQQPKVVVFGDDDVAGYNPAPVSPT